VVSGLILNEQLKLLGLVAYAEPQARRRASAASRAAKRRGELPKPVKDSVGRGFVERCWDSNLPVLDRPVLAQQLSANIFLFEKQLQWLPLVALLFAKHWGHCYFNW